jgi:hypothetical protein
MFAKVLAACAIISGSLASAAKSQVWNSAEARALVERATALRARQLADTGLVDYHATAHGYVTFLAQLGDGLREPPRIVRADQLALEVYWRAPSFSKQIIEGRRDTLLLPTDIVYHRDHLGIVQNNFPAAIRLGEGDEVRDVPHPLSRSGLAAYDFAIADSLTVAPPPVRVYRVLVRPHDPRLAGIVGSIYLEPHEGQVVRMVFSFTHAAFLQPELEDISVALENALVDGRFWLPNRQEIEIRRTGSWLDAPARGIIRARWEISDYVVNHGVGAFFGGPEIVSVDSAHLAQYPWHGGILDSIASGSRVVTDADMARLRDYVRDYSIGRVSQTAIAARSASDFVRVDRAEGLALGAGATQRFGYGFSATVRARYGFSDHQGKGEADLSWNWLTISGYRDYRDVGDVAEGSRLINSIAAQEFGADHTDPYDTRGVGAFVSPPTWAGLAWRLGIRRERQDSLAVRARPTSGHFAPTVPAVSLWQTLPSLTVSHPTSPGPLGTQIHLDAGIVGAFSSFARANLALSVERPLAPDLLVTRTTLAGVTAGAVPLQDDVFLGGPITGPGYPYHEFVGRAGATEHVEWQFPIPSPGITLGRYGTAPRTITLAPFAHVLYTSRGGWYPSAGIGVLALFNLVRFDVARGLRGGAWTFAFDLDRTLWPIL